MTKDHYTSASTTSSTPVSGSPHSVVPQSACYASRPDVVAVADSALVHPMRALRRRASVTKAAYRPATCAARRAIVAAAAANAPTSLTALIPSSHTSCTPSQSLPIAPTELSYWSVCYRTRDGRVAEQAKLTPPCWPTTPHATRDPTIVTAKSDVVVDATWSQQVYRAITSAIAAHAVSRGWAVRQVEYYDAEFDTFVLLTPKSAPHSATCTRYTALVDSPARLEAPPRTVPPVVLPLAAELGRTRYDPTAPTTAPPAVVDARVLDDVRSDIAAALMQLDELQATPDPSDAAARHAALLRRLGRTPSNTLATSAQYVDNVTTIAPPPPSSADRFRVAESEDGTAFFTAAELRRHVAQQLRTLRAHVADLVTAEFVARQTLQQEEHTTHALCRVAEREAHAAALCAEAERMRQEAEARFAAYVAAVQLLEQTEAAHRATLHADATLAGLVLEQLAVAELEKTQLAADALAALQRDAAVVLDGIAAQRALDALAQEMARRAAEQAAAFAAALDRLVANEDVAREAVEDDASQTMHALACEAAVWNVVWSEQMRRVEECEKAQAVAWAALLRDAADAHADATTRTAVRMAVEAAALRALCARIEHLFAQERASRAAVEDEEGETWNRLNVIAHDAAVAACTVTAWERVLMTGPVREVPYITAQHDTVCTAVVLDPCDVDGAEMDAVPDDAVHPTDMINADVTSKADTHTSAASAETVSVRVEDTSRVQSPATTRTVTSVTVILGVADGRALAELRAQLPHAIKEDIMCCLGEAVQQVELDLTHEDDGAVREVKDGSVIHLHVTHDGRYSDENMQRIISHYTFPCLLQLYQREGRGAHVDDAVVHPTPPSVTTRTELPATPCVASESHTPVTTSPLRESVVHDEPPVAHDPVAEPTVVPQPVPSRLLQALDTVPVLSYEEHYAQMGRDVTPSPPQPATPHEETSAPVVCTTHRRALQGEHWPLVRDHYRHVFAKEFADDLVELLHCTPDCVRSVAFSASCAHIDFTLAHPSCPPPTEALDEMFARYDFARLQRLHDCVHVVASSASDVTGAVDDGAVVSSRARSPSPMVSARATVECAVVRSAALSTASATPPPSYSACVHESECACPSRTSLQSCDSVERVTPVPVPHDDVAPVPVRTPTPDVHLSWPDSHGAIPGYEWEHTEPNETTTAAVAEDWVEVCKPFIDLTSTHRGLAALECGRGSCGLHHPVVSHHRVALEGEDWTSVLHHAARFVRDQFISEVSECLECHPDCVRNVVLRSGRRSGLLVDCDVLHEASVSSEGVGRRLRQHEFGLLRELYHSRDELAAIDVDALLEDDIYLCAYEAEPGVRRYSRHSLRQSVEDRLPHVAPVASSNAATSREHGSRSSILRLLTRSRNSLRSSTPNEESVHAVRMTVSTTSGHDPELVHVSPAERESTPCRVVRSRSTTSSDHVTHTPLLVPRGSQVQLPPLVVPHASSARVSSGPSVTSQRRASRGSDTRRGIATCTSPPVSRSSSKPVTTVVEVSGHTRHVGLLPPLTASIY